MKLILGGYAQGKIEYAVSLYPGVPVYDENDFKELTPKVTDGKKFNVNEHNDGLLGSKTIILNHFHLCVRHLMEEGRTREEIKSYFDGLFSGIPEPVVICDEIGNGVVPIDAFEREYRETVGRLTVSIAKSSESVERIICGIPVKLK